MYGERDEPYAVLSRLGQRLEATLAPESVLPTIVETVAHALKLPYVAIRVHSEQSSVISDQSSVISDQSSVVSASWKKSDQLPTDNCSLITIPLVYQTETIGQLILAPRAPGESFSPADRRLLEDIAHQAGVAVHAVRLTADLQRSREQLVTAREEERRRIRRDLHDGLGPALASLTLKLDAARNLLTREPSAADALLAELKAQTQSALADIRRLVYDLRPPALDELGLVSAVREHVQQYENVNGLGVAVEGPAHLPLLPAAVEVAAYRIAVEALTNVARHARARSCVIRFALDDALRVEIRDDGIGFTPQARVGVGLTSMRERAAELGGTCVVERAPEGGTRVVARLPVPKMPNKPNVPKSKI
jgi:signal transduction histidine kinase